PAKPRPGGLSELDFPGEEFSAAFGACFGLFIRAVATLFAVHACVIVAASATDCNLLLDRSSLPRTDGIAKQVRNLRRSLPSGLSLPELPLCFTLGVNGFLQPRKLLLTQLGGH